MNYCTTIEKDQNKCPIWLKTHNSIHLLIFWKLFSGFWLHRQTPIPEKEFVLKYCVSGHEKGGKMECNQNLFQMAMQEYFGPYIFSFIWPFKFIFFGMPAPHFDLLFGTWHTATCMSRPVYMYTDDVVLNKWLLLMNENILITIFGRWFWLSTVHHTSGL